MGWEHKGGQCQNRLALFQRFEKKVFKPPPIVVVKSDANGGLMKPPPLIRSTAG